MKRILLSAIILLFSVPSFSQIQPVGHLTIFSEDGTRFFLELNGERYNERPQTHVRIEALPAPYYSCTIVFENQALPSIPQKTVMIADPNGIPQDVTYRIKRGNKGRRTLDYYTAVPVQQKIVRPASCEVYHYGAPGHMIVGMDGTVYTQTVTVQENMGVGVNMGGMNVSVTMPVGTTTTTTTTTTTSTGGQWQPNPGHNADYEDFDGHAGGRDCRYAMSNGDFQEAKATIKDSKFDDTKQSAARQIISSNCLNANQVLEIIKLMSFDDSKLEIAKYAYNFCIDKKNYFKVVNAFTFESSKEELNEYIEGQR